jgi:signal transduction histidine kinase
MQETTELLLEEIPGSLNDKQRRLLELTLKSGKRLSSMIGNLLDLSRMEAGVMEYEFRNQDLAPLLQTAVEEFQVQAQEKQLHIRCALPEPRLMVECDGDRIIQVAANLISNAIKFSPPSAAIEVRIEKCVSVPRGVVTARKGGPPIAAHTNGFVVVSIADRGPGVPEQEKRRIFEKFHQARQPRIPSPGAGLGLAISRTIIDAHRGAIWVEDNPQGGSIFRFLLPSGGGNEAIRRGESTPI